MTSHLIKKALDLRQDLISIPKFQATKAVGESIEFMDTLIHEFLEETILERFFDGKPEKLLDLKHDPLKQAEVKNLISNLPFSPEDLKTVLRRIAYKGMETRDVLNN